MIVLGFPSVTGGTGGGGGGGSGLIASASPDEVSKTSSVSPMTTPSTTCTASGGTSPYTYHWAMAGGTINSPTSATTNFTKSLSPGGTFTGSAVCTVTDSLGATAASNAVTVNCDRSGVA